MAKMAIKMSSKVYKLETYDETIFDLIYGQQRKKTIKKELQNLEQHNIWKYNKLLSGKIVISSKWVFKVKYYSDKLVVK